MSVPPTQQVDRILECLKNVRESKNGWMACCPAHEDGTASLSVAVGKKGGVILKCFAGCHVEQIVAAMGKTMDDIMVPKARRGSDDSAEGSGGKRKKKAFRPVPAGTYVCRVYSVKEKPGEIVPAQDPEPAPAAPENNGNGTDPTAPPDPAQAAVIEPAAPPWKVRLLVCAGMNAGDSVWDHFQFTPKGLPRLKAFCAALGMATSGEADLTPDLLTGQLCAVQVEEIPTEGGGAFNRVPWEGYSAPADVTTYDYTDEAGGLVFQVVRFIPKTFRQRKPNGKGGWTWNLDGVRRVPYHVAEVLAVPKGGRVVLVEGERDVDNLRSLGFVATTSPQGAESWNKLDPASLECFRDKAVVVIPDDDAPGRAYAAEVAESLKTIAAAVRVLSLPPPSRYTPKAPSSGRWGKDASDWIAAGGTAAELERLMAEAPTAADWLRGTPPDTRSAKRGGSTAGESRLQLTNFTVEEEDTNEGIKRVTKRLEKAEILRSIRFICSGWPKRIGMELFIDHAGECLFLSDESDLFAYFHSMADILWRERDDDDGRRLVSRKEVLAALRYSAEEIQEVSELPLYPVPDGVYISSKVKVTKDTDGTTLAKFLSRFNPAERADEALLAAMMLTPFWGGSPGCRPLFVVTGPEGLGVQESGKTTLAELVGYVAGGVFRLRTDRSWDPLSRQILSDAGLRSRVMLIDNVGSSLDSSELAELITARWIEGRPAYGRQRKRSNRITWVLTAVSPELDEDLASRSVVIHISPPDRVKNPTFAEEMVRFIDQNRLTLISDCISILRGSRMQIKGDVSRFPSWDREVLACHEGVAMALEARRVSKATVSSRNDDIANFGTYLIRKLAGQFSVELTPQELVDHWQEATRQKNASTRYVCRLFRQFLRTGQLFKAITLKYPRKHGSPWVVDVPTLKAEVERESE